MFSETPGIPGNNEHMPLITKSISTPAIEARYSASTNSSSSSELSFNLMKACLPAFLFSISRLIFSSRPDLIVRGATNKRL